MQIVERTWIKTPSHPPQARSDGEHGEVVLWMKAFKGVVPNRRFTISGALSDSHEVRERLFEVSGYFHSRVQLRNTTGNSGAAVY